MYRTAMVISKTFEYTDAEGYVMEGIIAYPSTASINNKRSGVLVLHAFAGCDPQFEGKKAIKLAELGYVALAADVYGKGKRGSTPEENFAMLRPLMTQRTGTLHTRLMGAVNALKGVEFVKSDKIAAIGYCFGGLCALDLARLHAGLKAVISYHGTLTPLPDVPLEPIDTAAMVHHGDADPHINAEQVNNFMAEMRERKADWCFTSHSNAMHGFAHLGVDNLGHPGVAYNEKADRRSWAASVAFLEEKLT